MTESPLDPRVHLGLEREQLPRHVAIIMDGNGRWARQREWDRIAGHERGARVVRDIVTHSARLGLDALTLFSFSTENWKRPRYEVEALMHLYAEYLVAERDAIMDNNVRFRHFGRRAGLPQGVLAEMDRTIEMSRLNTGLNLCLALNYGGREEILDAVRALAARVARGGLSPDEIDEAAFSEALYTSDVPDPDLLIRTASQYRVSNFLLWQISYAEIHVCDAYWPDFTRTHFDRALLDYAKRERRFGDVAADNAKGCAAAPAVPAGR